jgi:hypothetical protein
MPKRFDIVELRQTGFGNHLQRLAGGVREQVEMKLAQRLSALWKSLFKSLAEPSGRLQGKDSPPFFGFDPQVDEECKSFRSFLWIAGKIDANPRPAVGLPESSCLQNRVEQ